MAQLNFGGTLENVVTREEFPLSKAQEVLKNEVVAVIGYGVQGPGQALNQKDNGINVIVGQRKNSKSWDKAVRDGFVPGKTLFDIEEALQKGTIICYLLSDAAQIALWPTVQKHLTAGKALYFSHGFGITFNEQTGIIPPKDVDVFLVAPKGSGTSLRRMFLQGRGLNSSYAIFQDATGKAKDRVIALGIAVGSGYLFETDFRKEVYSDLTGERGTLMGAIQGIFAAQYEVLRKKGHEIIALQLWDRDATLPVFTELYESVASGKESQRSIDSNSKADYREKLEEELKELRESELWLAGKTVRSLRPENQKPA